MADRHLVTPQVLRKLLDYDPATGLFAWRERGSEFFRRPADQLTWNKKHAGRAAFVRVSSFGYLFSEIFDQPYAAHRVAWAIVYGRWPLGDVDHVNGCRADNGIANLREVSRLENNRNKRRSVRNTSGVTGVSVDTQTKLWRAQITIERKIKVLGLFERKADAIAARKRAEAAYGFHKNHDRG